MNSDDMKTWAEELERVEDEFIKRNEDDANATPSMAVALLFAERDALTTRLATLTRERDTLAEKARMWQDLAETASKQRHEARTALAEARGVDPAMAEYIAASLAWWLDESKAAERLEGEAWERFHAAYYALSVEVRRGGK